jgi:hypothetical protein
MCMCIYIYTLSPKSVLDSTRKSKFRIHLRYFVLKGFVSTMFVSRVTEFRPRCLLLQMFVITNVSSFVSTMFFFTNIQFWDESMLSSNQFEVLIETYHDFGWNPTGPWYSGELRPTLGCFAVTRYWAPLGDVHPFS